MSSTKRISQISLQNVTKLFGPRRALYQVSMDIGAGEVVGLVGPNGAGKSTLLSILATTARPTFGSVLADGNPMERALRSRIGYLSHKAFVYPDLSCKENLDLFAALYGVGPERVEHVREQFALDGFFNEPPVRVLSRGQLQRLALARTLIASPDILLLDEPSTGLDQRSTQLIETLVDTHRQSGKMCIMVSHDPQLVSGLCTRIVVMATGEIVQQAGACSTEQISEMLMGATG